MLLSMNCLAIFVFLFMHSGRDLTLLSCFTYHSLFTFYLFAYLFLHLFIEFIMRYCFYLAVEEPSLRIFVLCTCVLVIYKM